MGLVPPLVAAAMPSIIAVDAAGVKAANGVPAAGKWLGEGQQQLSEEAAELACGAAKQRGIEPSGKGAAADEPATVEEEYAV